VLRNAGKLQWVNETPFVHDHPSYSGSKRPNDALYLQYGKTDKADKNTYLRRKKVHFKNTKMEEKLISDIPQKKRGRKPKVNLNKMDNDHLRKPVVTQVVETENGAEITLNLHEEAEPILLSVCVIAIPEHVESCKKLAAILGIGIDSIPQGISRFLHPQKQVEFLVNLTARNDKGGPTRGQKRQELLNASSGEYVCSIDADDTVIPDWVETILDAIESKPDCVGFEVSCIFGGKYYGAIVSNQFAKWSDGLGKSGKYERTPHHLAPIRREHAIKAGFRADVNYGEDYHYCQAVAKYLKNEVFIPREIYFYHK
jgi:hypothetical protein